MCIRLLFINKFNQVFNRLFMLFANIVEFCLYYVQGFKVLPCQRHVVGTILAFIPFVKT